MASAAPAEAGGTRAELRITAQVVERCTFTSLAPDGARALRLDPHELVEVRCGRRPVDVEAGPPPGLRPTRIDRERVGEHVRVTVRY